MTCIYRHLITLLLLVTNSLAQEKSVVPEARCGVSFTDPYKPVQIQVQEDFQCTWNIERPSNLTTRVIFSVLDLNPSADCSQENITIFDENNDVLGVLCPNSPKINVFESEGNVDIRVSTDSTVYARTAYFLYYSVTPDIDLNCGDDLQGYSGIISSPNYPNRHPHFAFCLWHLEAPKNTKLKLSFSEIFVEVDALCRFDLIAVYDGPDTNAPLLDVLCGRRTAELQTTSNSLTLLFSADYANSYFGFSVKYSALPESSDSSMSCSGDSMLVVLNPAFINAQGYSASNLTLIDPSCVAQSADPLVFEVPYYGCGTVKKVEDNLIYYTNTISAKPSSGVITRVNRLEIVVTCELDNNATAEIMYMTRDDIIHSLHENGKYDASLAFYTSQDFTTPVLDSPYLIDLNEPVYIEASVKTQDQDLTVLVDTCFASPNADFQAPNYDLIRSGCTKDNTYQNINSGSGFAQFSFNAFKFLNAHTSVYLQCRLIICDINDPDSRCNKGCITRQRRDLGSKEWKTNAVLGPIRLKRHSESEAAGSIGEKKEEPVKTDQGSLYVVVISVLVVNVVILALVLMRYYRKQSTEYRYLPVATQ
ncbi:CUB and zona pellucida-like domain-containing protein 1 isoform X1 [Bufo bufo]|uniref:CUB and zona pellucida-like domain-containing protein 1 isoform X1 n=1 Tax=Bufo bufo TaxID=8384 RepID=UPI001ABEB17B|nr:CUB and zona pellucida-like domain-containing protein 1 isoform X1 [Bufo bufo]